MRTGADAATIASSLPGPSRRIVVEPIIGLRQWRLAGEALLSIACDERWPEPSMAARCLVGGHPPDAAPVSACSCGVYAWYEPCPRTASAPTRDYVAGAVVLWGAIELHGTGMRAQHCRIVALARPLSRWGKHDRVIAVAERLGVPAVRHRDLPTVARQNGAPVATELRPPPTCIGSAQGPYGMVGRTGIRRPLL